MTPSDPSPSAARPSQRGFTLVELMIVVAILGILAAIAVGVYKQAIDRGKTTKLKEYAMEVEKGQKQYASRNGMYFTPGNKTYSTGDDEWEELLEFSHDAISPDTRVMTEAGTAGSSCQDVCPTSMSPDTTQNWYAIKVCRDMDGNTSSGFTCPNDTTVYLDNVRDQPVVLRKGE